MERKGILFTPNKLDTHDRFMHVKKQEADLNEAAVEFIKQRPFGDYPFYIFINVKTEGGVKKLHWQARLTKPDPVPNTFLFKTIGKTNDYRVIWILPTPELWPQYEKGKMTENDTISQYIHLFKNNRDKLAAPEPDDLPDEMVRKIYEDILKKTPSDEGATKD